MLAARSVAFIVGTLIAGCVYTSRGNATDRSLERSPAGDRGATSTVAIYPGAHKTSGNAHGDAADVTVNLPMVHLHMVAVRYDVAAAPDRVVAFYGTELARFGKVTVSKGGPHTKIHGFSWASATDQTTLAVDPGHIVAVRPLPGGTEFAVMAIEASGPSGH